ncbi:MULTISPECIES: cobalt-precorrin-5B (C(1))-methyltransferase [Candidatus Nitrosocaldus]|jgi:cobalt-precorrin-5B (C1)-methyltransferase|uniref:Cobalt-precorrin-5B C(1)-methyltransferase n=1 Tax=Candidatus Nitrosocaldus cavascurensis TaxID=2058097 RepID=A0A2K5AT27_9ARCH|nr:MULTISPECIES: cobalt-precorrin-5B (C(1))-methyltransferase [Candidatus Nitrosocaldus]SPC34808.1 Cobalt-precorrin-5B C(1)-methyltransferase [Candidatus Nitrosocaldus cavascurensis]
MDGDDSCMSNDANADAIPTPTTNTDINTPISVDDPMLKEIEEEQEQELPKDILEKKRKGLLRTGYTTGTCATAAAKAALISLISRGRELPASVTVTLPKGDKATLQVKECIFVANADDDNDREYAVCTVVKDAGDDPDVTHGAEIVARVEWLDGEPERIEVTGGKGVGIVTKPGLGLEIGKHAINPTPMRMIINAVREVASEHLKQRGVKVTISVPRGEELAKQTDNPRLGIVGGISILGTTGIVVPYSTASFAASIKQCIDVAVAMGDDTIVLTTGGRSEEFARQVIPNLPDHCFIQMGDFVAYSVRQAAMKGIKHIIIAGFIGKLSKAAKGIKQTHVKGSHVDMEFLADVAKECNASMELYEQIRNANTARHVMEIVMANNLQGYFDRLCSKVCERLSSYMEDKASIECIMFDFEGKIIGRASKSMKEVYI